MLFTMGWMFSRTIIFGLFSVFVSSQPGTCWWQAPVGADITQYNDVRVTDLRTPTPFNIVESIHVTSCSSWYAGIIQTCTAVRSGISYTATPVLYAVYGEDYVTAFTHTFPDLLVTMLRPGDYITVTSNNPTPRVWFVMQIPTDLTLTPGATSSFSTTSISSSTLTLPSNGPLGSEGLSRGEIGGIVAGAVCGAIIITTVICVTYLKSQKYRQLSITASEVPIRDNDLPLSVGARLNNRSTAEDITDPYVNRSIRYAQVDPNFISDSGRLGSNI